MIAQCKNYSKFQAQVNFIIFSISKYDIVFQNN